MKLLVKVFVAMAAAWLSLPLVQKGWDLLQGPGAPGWLRILHPLPNGILFSVVFSVAEVIDRKPGNDPERASPWLCLARGSAAGMGLSVYFDLLGVVNRVIFRPDASALWRAASYLPGLGLTVLMVVILSAVDKRFEKKVDKASQASPGK